MSNRNLVSAVVVVALVCGAIVIGMQKRSVEPVTPQAKSFTLVIKAKKLVGGDSILKVNQNDQVTITITSDEHEELHLHGYDKAVDLEENQPVTIEFKADVSGNFPFELEHSKTELGALEVQPR